MFCVNNWSQTGWIHKTLIYLKRNNLFNDLRRKSSPSSLVWIVIYVRLCIVSKFFYETPILTYLINFDLRSQPWLSLWCIKKVQSFRPCMLYSTTTCFFTTPQYLMCHYSLITPILPQVSNRPIVVNFY